jgi:hypothetical protein
MQKSIQQLHNVSQQFKTGDKSLSNNEKKIIIRSDGRIGNGEIGACCVQ